MMSGDGPDRAARRAGQRIVDREDAGARSATEQALARIWTEVLGVEQVGLGDDFFMLGGHSLLAVQLISRIREVLAIQLPLRKLFEESAARFRLEAEVAYLQEEVFGQGSLREEIRFVERERNEVSERLTEAIGQLEQNDLLPRHFSLE